MSNTIKYTVQNSIATISLNRPESYNAFIKEMAFTLIDALQKAHQDETVRVVVLTGEGKAFCSGQDLKECLDDPEMSFYKYVDERYNVIIKAIRNMPKPVICKLNGIAAGAGCSLAMACDLIVASEKASLMEVFVNVGLVLDSGSSYFLPRLVGSQKAFELATTAQKVTAQQAKEWGMVNEVVAPEALDEAVKKWTDYYATAPTAAIAKIKKMLNQSFESDLNTMLNLERDLQEAAGNSEDYKEGVNAFLEKRKAAFKGC